MSSTQHTALPPPPLGMEPQEPILLATPPGFSIASCIAASPIGVLPPLSYDPEQKMLQVTMPTSLLPVRTSPCEVQLRELAGESVLLMYGLHKGPRSELAEERVRWMLGLEEDLTLFHHLCERDRDLSWVAEQKVGRMLRSPSVFEDLVKVLITTQRPKQARAICGLLCRTFGRPTRWSGCSFPEPQDIAQAQPQQLKVELALGSLGHQIWQLAVLCAEGRPEPETMKRVAPSLSQALCSEDESLFDDLVAEELAWQERLCDLLLTLPGFGVRSVPKMMRMLGCYDLIEVHHSAVRAFAKHNPPKRKPKEPETSHEVMERMHKRLDGFGVYRSLAQSLLLLPRRA